MNKFLKVACLAAATLLPVSANAAAISVGQWYTFGFGNAGSPLIDGTGFVQGVNPASLPAPDAPWEFTVAFDTLFTVVDGFSAGDQFQLFDNLVSLGSTSLVPASGFNCGSDITFCLGSSDMSKGSFLLSAGSHSLSGLITASPFGGGAGFFIVERAVAAVPEPLTLSLFGAGLLGAGLMRRRRK